MARGSSFKIAGPPPPGKKKKKILCTSLSFTTKIPFFLVAVHCNNALCFLAIHKKQASSQSINNQINQSINDSNGWSINQSVYLTNLTIFSIL